MQVYHGKGVCGGIAMGRVLVYGKKKIQADQEKVKDPEAEVRRYREATDIALVHLNGLYEKALQEVGETNAAIFEIHRMILEDGGYRKEVEQIILGQSVNAEYAVVRTADQFAGMFAAMEDAYMRERAADVKDVSERLLAVLQGENKSESQPGVLQGENKSESQPGVLQGEKMSERLSGVLQGEGMSESLPGILQGEEISVSQPGILQGENISVSQPGALQGEDMSERQPGVFQGREVPASGSALSKNGKETSFRADEPVILVAEDLAPSETVQLDRDRVLSLVTVQGSPYSHTAILAGTMGIPAVVGAGIPLDGSVDGKRGIVDGTAGVIYIDPDEETEHRMRKARDAEKERAELLRTLKGRQNITLDGQPILLYANIGNIRDLDAALQNDAGGIGLFRSEFLYLEREDFPSEEEQFQIYRAAAEAMGGKRVVIRTLDIGADKECGYFGMEKEENPALGCRAIRICLTRPEIFKTQIRALFRASIYGEIAIMYPMITGLKEIRRIRELVEEAKQELDARGEAYGNPEQGIMIETPAAAIISDLLAVEVDFFSIGTNDLTQYLLAVDRQNSALDGFRDTYHPAVLRMIHLVVDNAHKAGIRAGICGELAADPALTREFLAMGVDELSVSPGRILPLRRIILETDVSEYRKTRQKEWQPPV